MMITTIVLNGVLGFVMIVTFCFCVTDILDQFVMSTAAFPYVNVSQM